MKKTSGSWAFYLKTVQNGSLKTLFYSFKDLLFCSRLVQKALAYTIFFLNKTLPNKVLLHGLFYIKKFGETDKYLIVTKSLLLFPWKVFWVSFFLSLSIKKLTGCVFILSTHPVHIRLDRTSHIRALTMSVTIMYQ